MIIKKQNGYVLISVLSMSVLLLLLGSSAIYMTKMGSQNISSEMLYQKARYASEVGIADAIKAININNQCGATATKNEWTTLSDNKAKYKYYSISDSSNKNCFIHSVGQMNDAKVVKTTIVPYAVTTTTTSSQGLNSPLMSNQILNLNLDNQLYLGNLIISDLLAAANISNPCGGPGLLSGLTPTGNNLATTINNITQLTYFNVVSDLVMPNNVTGITQAIYNQINAIKVDPTKTTAANIYSSLFSGSSGITNYTSLMSKLDNIVTVQGNTAGSGCSVIAQSGDNNLSCDIQSGMKVNCSGSNNNSYNKTFDMSACSTIALSTATAKVTSDVSSDKKVFINTSKELLIKGSVSGVLTSDGTLNIDATGKTLDGIFIGGKADNLTLNNSALKGLYFLTNSSSSSSANINLLNTASIDGSVVVDGSVNNASIDKNAKIRFNPENINKWGQYISDFLFGFSCGNSSSSTSTTAVTAKNNYIQKTKMAMY